ncbi:MAG: histidinol-phosphate transaminase [Bacillota bacterium]
MSSKKSIQKKQKIKKMLRPEVKAIYPYEGEEDDFEIKINLSGNESPFDLPEEVKEKFKEEFNQDNINRYPELYSDSLREKIAQFLSKKTGLAVKADEIIAGNGSDDLLDLIIRTFVDKGDCVLSQAPTFSMYKYFTEINGGKYADLPLKKGKFTFKNIKLEIDKLQPKLIFFCSPNNPTGEILDREVVLKTAEYYSGPVVIDEAYAEFSEENFLSEVRNFSNIAVCRTFSKAYGMAGARLGYLFADRIITEEVEKVLKPYNLNKMTDMLGQIILENNDIINKRVKYIKKERDKLFKNFSRFEGWRVYNTEANFVYIEGEKTKDFKNILNKNGIKVRSYSTDPPAVRITAGSSEDNDAVLKSFAEFKKVLN